jgi:alginate O-acetyltransferase complex protein AlgI
MVFASLTFLYFFLPANLILYYISRNSVYRNVLLTFFSFVFYAWGEPVWILLLIFSSMVDYGNALFIERHRGKPMAKIGIVSTVFLNAGILMAFKYSSFVVENINHVLGTGFHVPAFSLPIGISFYTFQTLSYVIDVYRGEVKAQKDPMKFLMFVSLYHQLVAGPIVRYSHIAHEIDNRKFNIGDMSSGVSRFCVGLFKKVCIANVAGEFVVRYLEKGDLSTLSVAECWFGIIMFTVQIYFDFSGYSDMAIGLGRMFGFHYHENFNYPYTAKSATEFWRRWHISLSTFFRDYIYIPLGGNRGGTTGTWMISGTFFVLATTVSLVLGIRTGDWQAMQMLVLVLLVFALLLGIGYAIKRERNIIATSLNLFIIWFFTGMWHGASWNFILWGVYFGVLIFIERLFLAQVLRKLGRLISHVYLLFVAIIGWALFYFTDFGKLKQFLSVIFGQTKNIAWNPTLGITLRENSYWLIIAAVLCMPVYHFFNRKIRRHIVRRNRAYLILISMGFNLALLFVATAMLVGKTYNPFIYYRF